MRVHSTCDKGEKTCPRYATGSLGPLQAGPGNLEFLKLFWPEIGLALEYGGDFVRITIFRTTASNNAFRPSNSGPELGGWEARYYHQEYIHDS